MGKVGATFLTSKNFDKEKLLTIMEKSLDSVSSKDKEILEKLILDFKNGDYSLITPQQVHFLNHNPESKWVDYVIFRYKFTNYTKKHIESDIPNHLIIEPVSACNIRCVMCFQVDETFTKNQNFMGSMEFDLFKKIIDDAYEIGIRAVTLTGRGEPTLHPKIGEMLEYCKGKFFELKMNTNATRLNERLSNQIIDSGVTDLVFSVDSYEKDEYESIRVLGKFDEVLSNIQKFKEINDSKPNSICATRVSGVKINEKQNPDKFTKFWKQYVDHVVMVELQERWDTYNNPLENAGKLPCDYLWGDMYVWFDGKCNPCDVDYKSELSVGTIKENSIKEIWKGEQYTRLRYMHKNGQRDKCFPCNHCPNW